MNRSNWRWSTVFGHYAYDERADPGQQDPKGWLRIREIS
jgi:hypothetical protein